MLDGPVAVLLNLHFPLIGFCRPPRSSNLGPLQFVDCDRLAAVFAAIGVYEVQSRTVLESLLSKLELQQLAPVEIREAHYWKAARLGDVIFNYWD